MSRSNDNPVGYGLWRGACTLLLSGSMLLAACHTASYPQRGSPRQEAEMAAVSRCPPAVAGLSRADEVIAAKIARKQKKLKEGNSRASNPGGYAQYRYQMRLGEDGTIPPNALVRAKLQADAMPELESPVGEGTRDGGLWDWEWLGPGNIGGRIRSILIHPTQPDTMWIGGVAGGIWKTTNGGAWWTPLDDFLPSLAVSCMVMDPNDPNTLYAGTGEGFGNFDGLPGAGVFKTTNGGAQWTQLPDTIPAGTDSTSYEWVKVNRLAISPFDGDLLFAATNLGIYKSQDGGWNWSRRTTSRTLDLKHSPTQAGRLVAGATGGAVMYTDDGGTSWNSATFSTAVPIFRTQLRQAFSPDPDSAKDTLLVDDNAGFNKGDRILVGSEWTTVRAINHEDDPDNSIRVDDLAQAHPVDEWLETPPGGRVEVFWANGYTVFASMNVGGGVLWRSIDFGQTFSLVETADETPDYLGTIGWYCNTLWVDPSDSDLVVTAGVDLYRSTTGGTELTKITDWTRYHNPGDSAHADHHFLVEHPDWPANKSFFSGNDGGIQKVADITSAGITSWTNLANNLGITQFYGGAAAPDGSVIIGGTQDNDNLTYLPSAGAHGWWQEETGDGGFCAVNPVDPDICYAEYWGRRIEKSTDGGITWYRSHDGIDDIGDGFSVSYLMMDPNDPDTLYAGGAEKLWRTTDAAGSWHVARDSIGDGISISRIDVAVGNSNNVWVGYGDGQVWRTSGSTSSWVRVDDSTLPNRIVADILISPFDEDKVFVVFSGYESDQVWLTSDAGATWVQRTGSGANALPVVQVNSLVMHPNQPWWIYAGTDVGVFASENRGISWNQVPRYGDHDGPVNTEVAELFWQGNHLIAATHGRGMYRCRPLVTVHVDGSHTGDEDGSYWFPYNTVQEGIEAAGNGTEVLIRGGDYDEVGVTLFHKRGRVSATEGVVIVR